DLSKIEAGQMTIERIDCSTCQVLHEVQSLMQVRAKEKNLALEIELDGPIPEKIHSDPTRLRQVLLNLVGNAIKFTPNGHVRVTAKLASPQRLLFQVADSGIGMTEEQMARLFKPFSQAD